MARRRMLQDIIVVEALLSAVVVVVVGAVVVVVVVAVVVVDTWLKSLQSFSTSWSKLMTDIAWFFLLSIMWETSDQLSLSNKKISFLTPT